MKKITMAVILVWILILFMGQETEEKLSYRERVLLSIEDDVRNFEDISYRLKKDETFLKEALQTNGMVLQYFDAKYRANRMWVLLAVKENGLALKYVSNMLKSDEDVVFEAVMENGASFEFAHEYLKKKKSFVVKLLKEETLFMIDEVDETLKQNKDLIETALAYDEGAFKYLDEALQQNRDYVLKFLKKNGWLLAYLDEKFQKDKALVTMAVMNDAYTLNFAHESLIKDKKFLLSLIEKNDKVLENIDEELWKDKDFLLKVLKEKGFGLQYASKEQKNNRALVWKAIERNGFLLEYAGSALKKDKALVLKALDSYSDPLKFADISLQKDRNFLKEAIEVNPFSIVSIDNDLSNDRELVLNAMLQNTAVLEYLPKLKKDKDFILEMIQRDLNVLPYIDASLKEDEDILKAVKTFPSFYANIENTLSVLALTLFFLFLYFLLFKNRKSLLLLAVAVLFLLIAEISKTYFCHGVFRMPYTMVEKREGFGLERVRCWVGDESDLSKLECYNMHVPEIYNDEKSRVITFPIRVFRSAELFSFKSPLLHLGGGGPGADMGLDSSYSLAYYQEEHDEFSLKQGRDLFIIDPRGAGLSKPLLTCDTFVDNFLRNMKKDLSLEESYLVADSDYALCIKKFKKQKVNFNGYNSIAIADDIHLLSESLGIDKWVLFGVSYSTTYAMFVAKKYPEIVETMILDSSCFPHLKLNHNYRMQVMDGYNALYNYKEKTKKQVTTLKGINIKERMWALHKKLNESPIEIDYLDLKVNGDYFVLSLMHGVYGTEIFKDLAQIIQEVEQNVTKSFLPYFETYINFLMDESYADISSMAHYCYEDKPFINFNKLKEEQSQLPKGFIRNDAVFLLKANDFCTEMNISSKDKTLADPIKTEIPTLFVHGEFDSITPLRDVRKEMKNFKNSKLLIYKTSHAVLGTEEKIEEDIAVFMKEEAKMK